MSECFFYISMTKESVIQDFNMRYLIKYSLLKPSFFVFMLLLALASCKPKQLYRKEGSCAVERSFLTPPDSLPKVKLDFSKTEMEIIDTIERQLGLDVCNLREPFALVLPNHGEVEVSLVYQNCERNTICFQGLPLVILLNSKGQILADGEWCSLNNLNEKVASYYFGLMRDHKQYDFNPTIRLNWQAGMSNAKVSRIISELKRSKQLIFKQYAADSRHKQACELEEYEVNWLKKSFHLKIELVVYKYPLWQPKMPKDYQ